MGVRPAAVPKTVTTVLTLPDGRDLAFAEYGDPVGLPVMAFHGTPGSRLQLAPADAAARAAGVRLVVPDRPGYGHSTIARHRRLADWTRDVLAVADHLHIGRFAALGVSGGGPHALACAAAATGRLTAVAVASSPSPLAIAPRHRHSRARRGLHGFVAVRPLLRVAAGIVVVAMGRFPYVALRLARRWMPAPDQRIVDDVEFRSWFVDAARRASPTTARAVTQDVGLFARDWRFDLGAIDVPVAIWHGAHDRLVEPWNAEVLGAAIPGAAVHICDGEGHLLFADLADRILGDLVAEVGGTTAVAERETAAP